jgi:predicted nucleic acid-binding protein
MASDVWIDSGGFYAMLDPRDKWHIEVERKIEELDREGTRYFTSDYVLDETVTLLQSRGLAHLVGPWLGDILLEETCTIEWMDSEWFRQVFAYFIKYSDKEWSFTDCFSFCVMERRKIHRALANDHHYTQAGFEPLLVA